MDDAEAQKVDLRREFRARRRAVATSSARGLRIAESVLELPELDRVAVSHVYLATRVEVPTYRLVLALLRRGVQVVVPVLIDETLLHTEVFARDLPSLREGLHGIPRPLTMRPTDPRTADAFIVPLVGFDRHCNRLGNGSGHYDRILAGCRNQTRPAPAIGLAFAAQEAPLLPRCPHDVALDVVVTESFVVRRGPT